VSFTLLRNGRYTENYTGQLSKYLKSGEIIGAAGDCKITAASRQDSAAITTAALLQNEGGETNL
jgi:NAD(P)H dehydrogenase (quinone)